MVVPKHLFKILLLFIMVTKKTNQNFINDKIKRVPRQASKECTLPPHPISGNWSFVNKPPDYTSQPQVPANTILEVHCQPEYILDGSKIITCFAGTWIPPIGTCKKTCPSIHSSSTMKVTCTYGNQETENCTEPITGTLVEFKCRPYYEDPRISKSKAVCLDTGVWSEKTPECAPVCGRAALKKRPTLIVGGEIAKKGDFPWQIALYTISDKELICGGTLLSERLVLTAAHCVSDNSGNVYPKELYIIVAGKYYRKFDDLKDFNYTQSSEIHDIFLPGHYEGIDQNFVGDIAILVTQKTLRFSERIQPVCIDWTKQYDNSVINSRSQKGYVSGWGYTKQSSEPSNELKSLRVPSIGRKECRNLLPFEFRRFMTYDKFCAGYKDNGTSVCRGDSGGGLVFKKEGRFFITGVVSLAPMAPTEEGGCDIEQYSLYTLIYNYTDNFILRKFAEFKVLDATSSTCVDCTTTTTTTERLETTETEKCLLPKHPQSGGWYTIDSSEEYTPGKYVPTGTHLKMGCRQNYKYSGPNVVCNNGKWSAPMGQCLATCLPLYSSSLIKVNCTFNNKERINCIDPVDGTIAKFACSQFYQLSSSVSTPSLCLNREWTHIPQCVPMCGKISTNSTTLEERYPWNVFIYKKSNTKNKQLVCEGILINTGAVITDVGCVSTMTRRNSEVFSHKDFIVVAGKYHQEYDHREDVDAQFSEIKRISVSTSSTPCKGHLALLKLKTSFKLSAGVQPVCIDWGGTVTTTREAFMSISNTNFFTEHKVELVNKHACLSTARNVLFNFASTSVENSCSCFAHNTSSVCKSRTGGSLVVKDKDKHYLVGILSTNERICEGESYQFFTNVSLHLDFLSREDVRYR